MPIECGVHSVYSCYFAYRFFSWCGPHVRFLLLSTRAARSIQQKPRKYIWIYVNAAKREAHVIFTIQQALFHRLEYDTRKYLLWIYFFCCFLGENTFLLFLLNSHTSRQPDDIFRNAQGKGLLRKSTTIEWWIAQKLSRCLRKYSERRLAPAFPTVYSPYLRTS